MRGFNRLELADRFRMRGQSMPTPVKLKPDPDYRPNPERAIFVQGIIDQALVDRLTPQILLLQARGREPITVYIDSGGGSTYHFDTLTRLLKASDQDFAPPCRIITCVTNFAASAAADLLVWGNYAVATRGSTVYFHGVRTKLAKPLTAEDASQFTDSLRSSNTQYAISLAEQCKIRFFDRLMRAWSTTAEGQTQPPQTRHLGWLVEALWSQTTPGAHAVLERAEKRRSRAVELSARVLRNRGVIRRFDKLTALSDVEFEGAVLKELISIETKANRHDKDWSFSNLGLKQLRDDFLLIVEYIGHHSTEPLNPIIEIFGDSMLTEEQRAQLEGMPPEIREKQRHTMLFRALLHPWLFLLALCQTLQTGENELTAKDAFWLGLIDEVIGDIDYAPFRLFVEYQPGTESETP